MQIVDAKMLARLIDYPALIKVACEMFPAGLAVSRLQADERASLGLSVEAS